MNWLFYTRFLLTIDIGRNHILLYDPIWTDTVCGYYIDYKSNPSHT